MERTAAGSSKGDWSRASPLVRRYAAIDIRTPAVEYKLRTSGETGMPFIGREVELDALRQAWLRRDEFPFQFVILAGESRIGKTRVVQEFYRWLNSHQDPQNYWPDTLETGQDSLHVNPSFDVTKGRLPCCLGCGGAYDGHGQMRGIQRNRSVARSSRTLTTCVRTSWQRKHMLLNVPRGRKQWRVSRKRPPICSPPGFSAR